MKIKNTNLEVDDVFGMNSSNRGAVSFVIDIKDNPETIEEFKEYCKDNKIKVHGLNAIDDIIHERLAEDSESIISNSDLVTMIERRLY